MKKIGIITRSENDKINRDTVIQYCNVIQGESHAQVFLDREKFDAMVRTVTGMAPRERRGGHACKIAK